MKPIRVLLLLHDLGLTGAAKVALDAFESFGENVEVRIVALAGGERLGRCMKIGRTQVIPWGGLYSRTRTRLAAIPLARSLDAWNPDVIYVNSVASLPLFDRVKLPKAPIILHVHELDSYVSKYAKTHQRQLLELPTKYVVVSDAVRSNLVEKHGVDAASIVLINAFVNEADFDDIPSQRRVSEDGPIVVGGSGFPVWHKGLELWLQTAAETARILGTQKVRFVWVGVPDEDYGRYFDYLAEKLGIQAITSRIAPTQQPLLEYSNFDVFALTSWEDSFPLVVLENMMLRKPVVCFGGSGGAPEQIGDAGIVVPEFSPRLMAEAIADLASCPEKRSKIGDSARKRVLTNYTSESNSPKILDVIRSVASPGMEGF